MIKLAGTWHIKAGDDPAEIDSHYYAVHVPNVRRLPKLSRHVIGTAIGDAAGANPACYRTAEIWFDSRADFEAAMESPEWAAIAADGFMPSVAGLEIVVYDVEEEWTPAAS
jgi:uncharacterized protein (TIGR02118 family)